MLSASKKQGIKSMKPFFDKYSKEFIQKQLWLHLGGRKQEWSEGRGRKRNRRGNQRRPQEKAGEALPAVGSASLL